MEVFFPAERLMGSAEGFGSGVPAREAKEETLQHPLRNDASNDRGLGNRSSQYLTLDRDAKLEAQRTGRLVKCTDGLTKRPGMVNTEFSKSKAGLLDVNRLCPESASSPAYSKFSDKTQLIKQKSPATGRRGPKRNSKPQKSRCDSFSLKNGLVGFHTASGGNDYLGMYGLKHDAFDVPKHIDELSLDELLCGSYKFPNIPKEKAKVAAGSSIDLLETLRKACVVLEDKKVSQAQKCVDIDDSCATVPTSFVASSSLTGQTNNDNGDSCISNLPSSDKVQETVEKITTNVADFPLYQPKDMLQRLSLPPQKDLDLLLADAGKPTPSRHSTDPNFGKPLSQRNGLPPLSWSTSFSGNSKLAADAGKMSLNRTICHGKWMKIENSIALQKSTDDFLVDFESLIFNQSLVPSLTVVSTRPEIEVASADLVLPASDMCSDELSPVHVAARTLVDMAKSSKKMPCEAIKLLKKPLQISMKPPSKSKLAPERSVKFIDPLRSTKLINPSKNSDSGFPSKKLKLTPTVRVGVIPHIEPARKGPFHWSGSSSPSSVRSPGKLCRDSTSGRDSYGTELFKKPFLAKPPRATESPRPTGLHNKFRNSLQ